EDHREGRGQEGGDLGYSSRTQVTGPGSTIARGPRAVHAESMSTYRTDRQILAILLGVVLAVGGAAAPSRAAPPSSDVTLKLSHPTLRKGEMVWVKGKVRTSTGKAVKGVKVRL